MVARWTKKLRAVHTSPAAAFSLMAKAAASASSSLLTTKGKKTLKYPQQYLLEEHQIWLTVFGCGFTLVPDVVLRGVNLQPGLLLNPGESRSSSSLSSFSWSVVSFLDSGAAWPHFRLGTTED